MSEDAGGRRFFFFLARSFKVPPAVRSNRDLGNVNESFYEIFFIKELDYGGPEVHGIYFRLLEETGNFWC